jgi:Xaa-Pro aminopeptidase
MEVIIYDLLRSCKNFLQKRLAAGKAVRGWEVDRAARSVIERAGYGKNFIHRTGHSIGTEDHANGANMDGLETRETRRLFPGTLFSIEPGIYLKEFGVRSEINVGLLGKRAIVTGPAQSGSWAILGENPE